MRILAIDHGEARCGCAICDPSGTIVRPLQAVPPDPAQVAALVEREQVELVVVGLPLHLSGESGDQARSALGFRDELAGRLTIPVETYDERLTTAQADRTARESGATADRDSIAAAHLLESYLAARQSQELR